MYVRTRRLAVDKYEKCSTRIGSGMQLKNAREEGIHKAPKVFANYSTKVCLNETAARESRALFSSDLC